MLHFKSFFKPLDCLIVLICHITHKSHITGTKYVDGINITTFGQSFQVAHKFFICGTKSLAVKNLINFIYFIFLNDRILNIEKFLCFQPSFVFPTLVSSICYIIIGKSVFRIISQDFFIISHSRFTIA